MNARDISFHNKLLQSLLDVDRIGFREHLAEILQTYPPLEVLERFIAPIIQEIGNGLSQGKFSLSQVYMGGRLCEDAIPALLAKNGVPPRNRVPLAIAVLQDNHILGKKIVFHALHSAGYHVIDYDCVPTPKELVERALSDGVRILLISVLMLPSALLIKEVRRLLDEKGAQVKIVVGGAPFNWDLELWKEVGADAMRASATESIPLVAGLLKEIHDE